jgi:hypothetical protein
MTGADATGPHFAIERNVRCAASDKTPTRDADLQALDTTFRFIPQTTKALCMKPGQQNQALLGYRGARHPSFT